MNRFSALRQVRPLDRCGVLEPFTQGGFSVAETRKSTPVMARINESSLNALHEFRSRASSAVFIAMLEGKVLVALKASARWDPLFSASRVAKVLKWTSPLRSGLQAWV